MKIYVIDGKPYTMEVAPDMDFVCGQCDIADLNREDGACKNRDLLGKCTRLGYDKYFKEYKGAILENMEVVDLMGDKKVYKRMAKGFTRRDVLRELILEMKTKYGVDIVRKCDSVEQCKGVIAEIVERHAMDRVARTKDMLQGKMNYLGNLRTTQAKQISDLSTECKRRLYDNKELEKKLAETEKSRIQWKTTAEDNAKEWRKLKGEYKTLKDTYDLNRELDSDDIEALSTEIRELKAMSILDFVILKIRGLFNRG